MIPDEHGTRNIIIFLLEKDEINTEWTEIQTEKEYKQDCSAWSQLRDTGEFNNIFGSAEERILRFFEYKLLSLGFFWGYFGCLSLIVCLETSFCLFKECVESIWGKNATSHVCFCTLKIYWLLSVINSVVIVCCYY